jgi:peroxiredoxin
MFLVFALFSAASGQVQRPGLKVGDKAPDFSLPNPDGKPVTLKEYTSRGPAVVIFYRGYW